MNTLEEIINKWQNDPQFKENFNKNPEEAIKLAGLELSPEDMKKMLKLQSKNEELEKRINK